LDFAPDLSLKLGDQWRARLSAIFTGAAHLALRPRRNTWRNHHIVELLLEHRRREEGDRRFLGRVGVPAEPSARLDLVRDRRGLGRSVPTI
jgi:hypothetical protein